MKENIKYRFNILLILFIIWEVLFWGIFFSIWFYMERNVEKFVIENSKWLYLNFALLPFYIIYFWKLLWKNKAYKRLADQKLLNGLIVPGSNVKSFLRTFFFRNALVLFVIALANPQFGKGEREAKAEGIEIMIAFDVSKSMLAKDIHPKRDRLNIAKLAVEKLLDQLHGDKVGIVVFAGDAFNYVPITNDYRAIKMYLNNLSSEMVQHQGTNIGWAIRKSLESFDFENDMNKSIIIISDGENHNQTALDAVAEAKEKGVVVNTVGMGLSKGAPIPVYKNGKQTGLKKDREGNTVLTKLNEPMLIELAQNSDGIYVPGKSLSIDLKPLVNRVDEIEKSEFETTKYEEYEDQFFGFLTFGWVFFIFYLLLTDRKSSLLEKWNV